uniref:Pentatricopeptide repeat-containing protein n=1 Tax=Steinernema glaseri TaxID=37863 RepID=A0A1I8AX08_9BILA
MASASKLQPGSSSNYKHELLLFCIRPRTTMCVRKPSAVGRTYRKGENDCVESDPPKQHSGPADLRILGKKFISRTGILKEVMESFVMTPSTDSELPIQTTSRVMVIPKMKGLKATKQFDKRLSEAVSIVELRRVERKQFLSPMVSYAMTYLSAGETRSTE